MTDVGRLGEFLPHDIADLREIKQRGERSELVPDQAAAWRASLAAAIAAIDAATLSSILPPEPPPKAVATVDAWLRQVRRASW